jgi:hypothetical protein
MSGPGLKFVATLTNEFKFRLCKESSPDKATLPSTNCKEETSSSVKLGIPEAPKLFPK